MQPRRAHTLIVRSTSLVQITEEERVQLVENVLSTAVSQTGVDLNAVAASTWQQATLQFVPGWVPGWVHGGLCAARAGKRAARVR